MRDSIGRTPLVGATVQLVASESTTRFARTAVSDSLGSFTLSGVPNGRYMLGFFHPMLDSLGLEPTLREVRVEGGRPVRADLAIPSAARLRDAICGAQSAPDLAGLVVGVVRNAGDRAPIAGASVIAEWLELSFTPYGVVRHTPRLVATTAGNGWFAVCNVPSAGMLALIASRGADSTDRLEMQIPADGFLRREFYLGSAAMIASYDTAHRLDTLASRQRRLRVGEGRVNGTVVAAVGGRPLAGAFVSIADGPDTRANERGEWTLVNAPVGTRMLEVRAIGYYPEHRAVDVFAGAPPVRVALSTMKAVLDTVRVIAFRRADLNLRGFEERRRSGAGRYLTPKDIERRNPIQTTDIFLTTPGVRVDRGEHDSKSLRIRGAIDDWCSPTVYFNGMSMQNLSADDIDALASPHEIAGIEIYSEASVPAQYQQAMTACGTIAIWTKSGAIQH